MRFFILLSIAVRLIAASSPIRSALTGKVRDDISGEPLAAANVRILGTTHGTITNTAGEYMLSLEPGDYRLLFTMLGYAPDTVSLRLLGAMRYDVRMQPSAIVLPEVVVTSEDPAIEIIRRAIANKQRWIDRLKSYELQAFTRQTIYRDTAIAAINESYSRGYWQQGDTLREIVTQRRQTANIRAEFNFASVGRILNFAEDEIRFVGYTFVGPTAHDALDYYDYKLLRTESSQGQDLYEIAMIPRTRTVPLFEGTIRIASNSYALVGVDVHPNDALRIPFVRDLRLRYRQQFGLYESTYWMPADIRIEGGATISLLGFSIPPIGFSQTSVISEYSINTPIPDSIFTKPRLVIDSSAMKYDSSSWAADTILPLSNDEARAYRTLDSSKTLDMQFRPGGVGMTLGAGGGALGTVLSWTDAYFNRVEGVHLGALISVDTLVPNLSATGGLAYGFSSKMSTYTAGATYFTSPRRTFGIGAQVYRKMDHHPDRGYFSPFINSITSLLAKQDYYDYFRAEGERGFFTYVPSSEVRAELSYTHERDDPADQRTNYSLFYQGRSYRANPKAAPGTLRSVQIDMHLGPAPLPLDLFLQNGLDISIEHSSPRFTGGDFDFTRYEGVLSLNVPTFGRSFLLPPGFRLRASAGDGTRALPVQRWFDIETAAMGFAPFGVMRGARIKEFSGTGYVALTLEHNFRTLPFLALGIPFLYENNIELIIYGGAARTWSRGTPVTNTTSGFYHEAGFSISRIVDLLRADFTWRLSAPRGFYFTLGVASIF